MNRLVLGVDGGNSKTVAAVADHTGRIIGLARGGSTDIHGAPGGAAALDELAGTVIAALREAATEGSALSAAAFSLAGADWPEDFAFLIREIRTRLGIATPKVVNDSMGALRSGSERWEGIVVACGTHNAVGARRRDGQMFHLGFWPDRAGGLELGAEALRSTYRSALGLGPKSGLACAVVEFFGEADGLALMHSFTRLRDRRPTAEVARLASLVLDSADAGDATAQAIVSRTGEILGHQARVSAKRVALPLQGATVVLTGGVLQHPSPHLADAIMAVLPGAIAVRPSAPPVVGALLLAFDELGVAGSVEELAAGLR